MEIISLTERNIDDEHICCAISDKKCADGVRAKKALIKKLLPAGYRFDKLDVRGKVFLESVPAEGSWLPVDAPGWRVMNCFWVSGSYKGSGWAKALLSGVSGLGGEAGLVAVTAEKKRPFLSDPKFLKMQGFEIVDRASPDFVLWARPAEGVAASPPRFLDSARSGRCEDNGGLSVYYSDFCPFTSYWHSEVLAPWAAERGIPLSLNRIESREQGRSAPVPYINNAVFYRGEYFTSEIKIDRLMLKNFGIS